MVEGSCHSRIRLQRNHLSTCSLSSQSLSRRRGEPQPGPWRLCPQRSFSGIHQFDTYRLVQRLEAEGFSRERAEAIMASLSEVVSENLNNISRTSVAKSEFEKAMYMNKVDFAHVRNEIQMLENNEFALLRSDIGRLNAEVEKFRTRMVEDVRRVQSNVRLELSLEKGRIRDEQSAQELKIKEADSKIDTEVSTLRTQMETIQWELFKTLFPLFCAAGALFFSMLLTFNKR
ncbi:hypothetical protein BC832DRAFT_594944 [Gaertneriomyces semiglobifer]|nr:hypothetical protein BC832DRAFT_594944 [Gaertneriomyces semiglobifer]